MKDIYNRVVKCILEVDNIAMEGYPVTILKPHNVTDGFNLHVYFNRIEVAEIAMECEKEFNIAIPDNDVEEWKTVSDIVNTIERIIK